MSFDEINEIYKAISKRNREDWEKIRIQCFYSLIAFGGANKIKKPSDLFKLSDEEPEKKQGKTLTKEQIEKNRAVAEKMINKLGGY